MENAMQMSVFDLDCHKKYKITKPIRLIELFAGIGSQAKALRNIGADFRHYRVVEFDKHAIKSYNAIHKTNFLPSDITKLSAKDLGITETDKYDYILTYSFPCQDLSPAGKRQGMAKGSNTRSGLLWEVERLLKECKELPQVLLMENVPQVLNCDFGGWLDFLQALGYKNYYKILNAKNFGIPQNRKRCFMVSVLGNYYYDFPKEIPLKLRLKDMLESKVNEKYYIKNAKVNTLLKGLDYENADKVCCDMTINQPRFRDIANTIKARYDCGIENQKQTGTAVIEPKCEVVAQLDGSFESTGRIYSDICVPVRIGNIYGEQFGTGYAGNVWDKDALSPTLTTMGGGNRQPMVLDEKIIGGYRIRKLTPKECWRLMGFSDKDFYAAQSAGVSNSQLYKQAGNSIVVNVLEEIFKKLF
jgi:DNA (cytosine-5)-methyltransferase 1